MSGYKVMNKKSTMGPNYARGTGNHTHNPIVIGLSFLSSMFSDLKAKKAWTPKLMMLIHTTKVIIKKRETKLIRKKNTPLLTWTQPTHITSLAFWNHTQKNWNLYKSTASIITLTKK